MMEMIKNIIIKIINREIICLNSIQISRAIIFKIIIQIKLINRIFNRLIIALHLILIKSKIRHKNIVTLLMHIVVSRKIIIQNNIWKEGIVNHLMDYTVIY